MARLRLAPIYEWSDGLRWNFGLANQDPCAKERAVVHMLPREELSSLGPNSVRLEPFSREAAPDRSPWVERSGTLGAKTTRGKALQGAQESKRMILTADRPAPKTDDDLGGEDNPETTQSTVLRFDRQLRRMSSASAFAASLSPIAGNYCERPAAEL